MHVKPPALRKLAVSLVLLCAAAVVAVATAKPSAGSAESASHASPGAPLPAAPTEPPPQPSASQGSPAPPPAEPTVLASWSVREDPSSRGLALGWQSGGFAGTSVTVPDTMRPRTYSGRAG